MYLFRRSAKHILFCKYKFNLRTFSSASNNSLDTNLKPWQEIPGPPSYPVLGQLLTFLPGGMLYNKNEELPDILYRKYGPIVRIQGFFGSLPLIFLYDPEAAIAVFRSENWTPNRPGFESLEYFRKVYSRRDASSDALTGLLTEHGESWRKFRTIVNPVMLQPKTIKLYKEPLIEVAEDMVKRMKTKRNEKNMIEGKFDIEMNLWALESIGIVALGGRLNCFDANLPSNSPVRKLIQSVHDTLNIAEKLDFRPSLWRYFSTPTFKKAMKYYEEHVKINKYFVNKAMEELKLKDNTLKNDEEKGVLEKLLEIDPEVAVTMASEMLLAGVDTTANSVIGVLYQLANNAEKQDKLREEILSGREKRPYIRACIKEAIRLMPVVGGNLRKTSKEYNVLGYKIPKGIFLIVANQYMCLMDENFPRANEFIPERWLVDKNDPLYYGNAHPFVYGPFGYGVRSCIGRRIAELEIETFVSKVIENFRIEWFGEPLKTRASTLNYLIGPYNFIFKDVKSNK